MDFNQVGPRTGRFSCRKPNMQNVANALTTRSPMPIQARTPFVPRPGYVWYAIDYSQLEVRIFADVSQEPSMLEALDSGEDLHDVCTNKAWGGKDNPAAIRAAIHSLEFDGTGDGTKVKKFWDKEGVALRDIPTMEQSAKVYLADKWLAEFDYNIVKAEKSISKKTSRAKAKMILFAKLFGGGPNAIKDLLYCDYHEAAEFLRDYDGAFPEIVQYIRDLSEEASGAGYIMDCFGRRIAVDPDTAYRAVNYKVQGSAASLLKQSMRRTHAYLKKTKLDAHLLLTIHDEIVFEVRKTHAKRNVLQELCRIMEDHGGAFGVPTPVEIDKVTESWNVKKKAKIGVW